MKHNLGSYDVGARTVAGLLILLIGVHLQSWWGLVGLVPLVTAVCGFCPAYLPFGFDTFAEDERTPSSGTQSSTKNV
jgi:hypothetical protein